VAAPKGQPPADALYVLTHVDVFPVHKDAAIELVKVQAEAARKDDGNLRYDVVQWDGHPNHFTLVEVWRDRKAFDASVTTPHNKEFRDKLTPLEGALYDERLYQAGRSCEPKQRNSPRPPIAGGAGRGRGVRSATPESQGGHR